MAGIKKTALFSLWGRPKATVTPIVVREAQTSPKRGGCQAALTAFLMLPIFCETYYARHTRMIASFRDKAMQTLFETGEYRKLAIVDYH